MITVPYKNVWIFYLIFVTCQVAVLEASSVGVATTLPPKVKALLDRANVSNVRELLNNTRRILNGKEAGFNRPYMVFLKLPSHSSKFQDYRRWLCGGVIVHEEYIITSAACIEDVKHFYIVSGTDKYSPDDDMYTNFCIKNGAKKAVWKCIPRNYVFDGHENDNIRWMNNDIAVVKVDEEFDFTRKIRGCDYIPKPICYNNQSLKKEAPDTTATIAGWGSKDKYNDWVNNRRQEREQVCLQETEVTIMAKGPCKKRWGNRYANIIDNYMVCSRDMSSELSEICQEKYVDCVDIEDSAEEDRRRYLEVDGPEHLHSAYHNGSLSRRSEVGGGFCENDHGGPLVVGSGVNSMVIGIISACLVKEKTNKCYGPFLYTSVYKNRNLINCAIYKNVAGDCNKMFRAGSTHTEVELSWTEHPDGPSKHDIKKMRRMQEESKLKADVLSNVTQASTIAPTSEATTKPENETTPEAKREKLVVTRTTLQDLLTSTNGSTPKLQISDKIMEHSGLVLRSGPDQKQIKIKISKGKVKKPSPSS